MPKGIKNEVSVFNLHGEIVYEAESLLDASKFSGVPDYKIHYALREKSDTCYKSNYYIFKLKEKKV